MGETIDLQVQYIGTSSTGDPLPLPEITQQVDGDTLTVSVNGEPVLIVQGATNATADTLTIRFVDFYDPPPTETR